MRLIALCVLCLFAAVSYAAEPQKLELKDGDRVALIGNTFIEREQNDCYIETMLTTRYPTRNITFRNLGYSADTVTGEARGLCIGWSKFEEADKAFERLRKLVAEYKPTVLMINYGMTESFFGPDKLPEFTSNYNKMLDALSETAGTSPRLVLMSPNYHENLGPPLPDPAEHNKNLKLYSEAIGGIAGKRGAVFIDLFSITQMAADSRSFLTTNGIHLTPDGYCHVACAIGKQLNGAESDEWRAILSNAGRPVTAAGVEISNAAAKQGALTFTALSKALPKCAATPETEGSGAPQLLGFQGLAAGKYQLTTAGHIVGEGSAENWQGTLALHATPEHEQAEALRKLIIAKNFDYFAYQRPDNDSYILAFRKREQGRNAVELPQFLPLVEEKEKQITLLRVPKPVTYTLEAVK